MARFGVRSGALGRSVEEVPWGERTLHYKLYQHGGRPEGPGVDDAYDNNLYTFGELVEYRPTASP